MTKGEGGGERKNERGVLLHRIALISNRDTELSGPHQSIPHSSPLLVYHLFFYLREPSKHKEDRRELDGFGENIEIHKYLLTSALIV